MQLKLVCTCIKIWFLEFVFKFLSVFVSLIVSLIKWCTPVLGCHLSLLAVEICVSSGLMASDLLTAAVVDRLLWDTCTPRRATTRNVWLVNMVTYNTYKITWLFFVIYCLMAQNRRGALFYFNMAVDPTIIHDQLFIWVLVSYYTSATDRLDFCCETGQVRFWIYLPRFKFGCPQQYMCLT